MILNFLNDEIQFFKSSCIYMCLFLVFCWLYNMNSICMNRRCLYLHLTIYFLNCNHLIFLKCPMKMQFSSFILSWKIYRFEVCAFHSIFLYRICTKISRTSKTLSRSPEILGSRCSRYRSFKVLLYVKHVAILVRKGILKRRDAEQINYALNKAVKMRTKKNGSLWKQSYMRLFTQHNLKQWWNTLTNVHLSLNIILKSRPIKSCL